MVETSWAYWWPFVRIALIYVGFFIALYLVAYLAGGLALGAIMYKHGVDIHEALKIEKEWWRRHEAWWRRHWPKWLGTRPEEEE